MASASGMTPPVPFRVGATVTCELNALRDDSELEVTPEDAGPSTSCVEAGGCAGVAVVPCCGHHRKTSERPHHTKACPVDQTSA